MKATKRTKVWLIFLGVLLAIDVFVTSCLFAADVGTHTLINGVLNCVNVLVLLLLSLGNNKLEIQRDELKEYKDNSIKYFDYLYDKDNTHGKYIVLHESCCYYVVKTDLCHSDGGYINYVVKAFKYNTIEGMATAKAKAEELLNLITENGTLWQ